MRGRLELERLTPVELYRRKRKYWLLNLGLMSLFLIGTWAYWRFIPQPTDRYSDIGEHFKYGSIGSDNIERGLPFWIWKVLPSMFPEYLPDNGKSDYEAFGLIREGGSDRYVGFSKRRVLGIDLVGLNCAACHVSTYRESLETAPQLVLGMPAHQLDLQGLFQFFFRCVSDSRFHSDGVLAEIDVHTRLSPIDRFLYRQAIEQFRRVVLTQKEKLDYWNRYPPNGPGRIDTFGPYKALFFDLPAGDSIGTSDFPSLWNQRMRIGMDLHWDGNNASVAERNLSASIGAGAIPSTLDHDSLDRIADYILDAKPPAYPFPIDKSLADRGRTHYVQHCADCHDPKGTQIGKVVSINELGTDPHRLNSFTTDLVAKMNTLGTGYEWQFKHFRKTEGYTNSPLDGIWLRAPYLHNGSVPTLWHLLSPSDRPEVFYRGDDRVDQQNIGFGWSEASAGDQKFFQFDTTKPGNGNGGHDYGSELSKEEKRALLEYMKTF